MDRLPTEIREQIVEAVAQEESCFDGDGMFTGRLWHIVDIKALRLTCRALAHVAPRFLFSELWLFLTSDSIGRIEALAKHPSYSGMVRSLVVFWKHFDDNAFESEEAYTKHLSSSYLDEVKTSSSPMSLKMFEGEPSRKDLRTGWLTLNDIRSQHHLHASASGTHLKNALSAFSGLVSITAGFTRDTLMNEKAMAISSATVPSLARSTMLRDPFHGSIVCLYEDTFVTELIHALSRSKCQVQKLVLYGSGGVDSTFLDFAPEHMADAMKVASGLKELRLRLQSCDAEKLDMIVDNGYLTRFLGWMSRVKVLSLQVGANPDNSGLHEIELAAFFGSRIQLPLLKELNLSFFNLRADDLVAVIDRHRASLEILSVCACYLIEGTWLRVFEGMRGERKLQYCFFEDNMLIHGKRPNGNNRTVRLKVEGLEERVNAFAFGGQDFPEGLCDDLKLEAFQE